MSKFNDSNSIAAYWQGRSDRAASFPGSSQTPSYPPSPGLGVCSLATEMHYEAEILDLKKRLVAARAVRDKLRDALIEVAPDHPLVSPPSMNPILQEVAVAAGDTVKKWNEQV